MSKGAEFPERTGAPYFGIRGFAAALALGVLLSWPMLLASGPLQHFDTMHYYDRGAQIVAYLAGQTIEAGGTSSPSGAIAEARSGMKVRSLAYSFYAYLSGATPFGLYALCLAQATVVLWAFLALIPPLRQRDTAILAGGCAFVALASSLPWFVSYAMPDILGAVLPIYYICLLGRMDELVRWQRWTLMLLATAAILAHYGNLPLAAALALAAVAYRGWTRSLRPALLVLAIAPVVLATAFNIVGGAAAANEVSAAPKRMPILLARSLEDGPARWYLEDACPEAGYAMCDLFDTMPDNIASFLWAQEGYRGASDELVAAIRAEENIILWEAFKRYPARQTQALFRNAARQLVAVGTDDHWPLANTASALRPEAMQPLDAKSAKPGAIVLFDAIVPVATLLAALAYGWGVVTGRIAGFYARAGLMLFAALIVNAVVFGGLSAPVDRYQGRLVWLVPALAAIGFAFGRTSDNAVGAVASRPEQPRVVS